MSRGSTGATTTIAGFGGSVPARWTTTAPDRGLRASLLADALSFHRAALAAVRPEVAVAACLFGTVHGLTLRQRDGGERIHAGPVRIVAVGKAAHAMAAAAASATGNALAGGVVVGPPADGGDPGAAPVGLRLLQGSHPVPGRASVEAGRALLDEARGAGPDTLLLVLLSGGASALAEVPAPGIGLEDVRQMTARLLASGADIQALNTVRKHCSVLKGGGLLRAAGEATAVWTLALSDVVGDDPGTIGSGPTAPDATTYADALDVVERWMPGAPTAVRDALVAGAMGGRPETVKPGDPLLERAVYEVVASNASAQVAMVAAAAAAGYDVVREEAPITGDAGRAGIALARRLRALPGGERPVALVAGGEPTVAVVRGGRGGRAQHLALSAAPELAGTRCLLLAAGTDGVDGPTDAAGGWVDGATMADAARLGIDVEASLRATDAYRALERIGALLRTGPTGTNVADVVVALRAC